MPTRCEKTTHALLKTSVVLFIGIMLAGPNINEYYNKSLQGMVLHVSSFAIGFVAFIGTACMLFLERHYANAISTTVPIIPPPILAPLSLEPSTLILATPSPESLEAMPLVFLEVLEPLELKEPSRRRSFSS